MSENDFLFCDETENQPLISVVIASFDLLSGIKICHRWIFEKIEESNRVEYLQNLDDVLKVTLNNVHRQSENNFENGCVTSTAEFPCFEWFLTNVVFLYKNSTFAKRGIFISVGFIFHSKFIGNNLYLNNSLMYYTKIFANFFKQMVIKNENFNIFPSLKGFLQRIANECSRLININLRLQNNGLMSNITSFSPSPENLNFFAILLTSHMQTQMTTVIESSSYEDAKEIAMFLIHFMLPFQRDMSSLQHNSSPVNNLFLQCVDRQKCSPENLMISFERPVTWLRLPEKQIFRTSNLEMRHSASVSSEFLISTEMSLEEDQISQIKNSYQVHLMSEPSFWALVTYSYIIQFPDKVKLIICQNQFSEVLNITIELLSICKGKVEKDLAPILKNLRVISKQGALMVMSLTQIYDHNFFQHSNIKKLLESF